MGGSGKYIDRPTITYSPITGQKFNLSFMKPIPPGVVLFLIQSGWPADLILSITLDSINGLRSRVSGGANMRSGDPEFYRFIDLFRKVQNSGAVGMRVIKVNQTKESTLIFFYDKRLTSDIRSALEEINSLLSLKPDVREFEITYGLVPQTDNEICMLTRSMMQVMVELAGQVDIPPSHVKEGRAALAFEKEEVKAELSGKIIHIKTAVEKPAEAFTVVEYRDNWFWIDDRDYRSKRTFAFLMMLFSLTETGGKEGLPLVTIPAG
jgi:hypothetical protein